MAPQEAIWVQLFIGQEKIGQSFGVYDFKGNVDQLKKAVKEEWGDDLPCRAPKLNVYKSGTAIPVPEGKDPIDPGDQVPGDTTSKQPLIVVAPQPQEQQQQQASQVSQPLRMERNSTSEGTIPEHFVPLLLTLAVSTMKSGWEKISSQRTQSESSAAMNNSVSFYGLRNKKTCQILGDNTAHVINAHIWPYNNRHGLVLVDLQPSDIDNPKNVLRLHHDIEHHLDRFNLTFVLSGSDFVLKILNPNILNLTLKDRSETFRDLDGRYLQCPSGNRNLPWRRLLATHSIFAHQKARAQNWLPEDQYTAAETNAHDLMEFSLDTEAQARLRRFLIDDGTMGGSD